METTLPGEAAAEAAVAQRFSALLERSDRLLALALEIIGGGGVNVTRTRGVRPLVLVVVFGLYAKACKTFRAVRLTAAKGMGEDAFILGRALFETTIAILWILQRGSSRRALMYIAHLKVTDRRFYESLAQTKGTKRMAMKGRLATARDRVSREEATLGPDVVKSLRRNWSGMSLEETAKSLRWGPIYQLFYRRGSRFGHVADLADHVQFDVSGVQVLNMVPSHERLLDEVLRITYGLMWGIVARTNERLGLGHHDALKALALER